ncbi:MAG: tetratricopeptide repeat protein [bacterium]
MIRPPRTAARALLPALLVLTAGCAYFNTFYNAEKSFKEGLRLKGQNQQVQAKAKFDKSIEKSASVIQRWPRSRWVDDALFLVGRSYYETAQFGKAVRHFDQLELAFPKSPFADEAALYRARAMLGERRYAEGMLALEAVRADYPRLADAAAFAAARSLIERDEAERGSESLAVLLQRWPRSSHRREALRLLADAEFKLEQYDRAAEHYARYIKAASDPRQRAEAQLLAAAALIEQGKSEPAARLVRDVIGRYPQLDDQANLLLGRALQGAGREADAIAAWTKVKAQNEYGSEAMYRIGRYHETQGDIAVAKAYFDTARTRRAESRYGILAARRSALAEALEARSGKTKPADAALFGLAEAHNVSLGEHDRALELYGQVYDSFPQSDFAPQAMLAAAWILRSSKSDTAAAEPLLRRLVETYPDTEFADEARRWLGLPVPKRKKPEVADTTAARPDTGKAPTPSPEPLPGARPEPGIEPEPVPLEGLAGAGYPDEERLRELAREREPVPAPTPAPDTTVRPEPPARDTTRAGKLVLETVYFGTDSSEVRQSEAEVLRRNSALLRDATDVRIVVVGHCDPRASERYNQSLGLRRARAVRDILIAEGVGADRIEVRSEGERRPVSTGPDEYWLDRRVVFEQP